MVGGSKEKSKEKENKSTDKRVVMIQTKIYSLLAFGDPEPKKHQIPNEDDIIWH